ncbi:MAG: methylenetetrahydrofolate reductase [NAD(P)H] [Amylibacter sp.]
MNINDPTFGLSFEVFPPRSLNASFKLWRTVEELAKLAPSFISVTYGAGGSTREISKAAVSVIGHQYGIKVAGHLTCINSSREDVMAVATAFAKAGVSQIIALRGDTPEKMGKFNPKSDSFQSSLELISALADSEKFKICVAAYPNIHPEAQSAKSDIDMLKAKFDAGAESAITQFFFESDDFLRFRDDCADAGIYQKIIPGILPIENWTKTKVFAIRCGAKIPGWMDKAFVNATNRGDHDLLSTAICAELCDDLLAQEVGDLHFYTLNDPILTKKVCCALGRKLVNSEIRFVA